jgi:hypothetical protein
MRRGLSDAPEVITHRTTHFVLTPAQVDFLTRQKDAEDAIAKGDLAVGEAKYRAMLALDCDHIEIHQKLAKMYEAQGRYADAAEQLGMIVTGKTRKLPHIGFDDRSPLVMARFRDALLKSGGHAAVVHGFDPIRDEKFNRFNDEPLGGNSGTSYSMRDMNKMGMADEDIIELRHAFWLTGVNRNDPRIKLALENTLRHWPKNYEVWTELQVLSEPAEQFKVAEREYLAADPAHRLRMKKYYALDYKRLDAQLNPQP